MHEPEIEVRGTKLAQRILERLGGTTLIGIIELRSEEERLAGNTGGLDTLANFTLVLVGSSSYKDCVTC
jgi:hypothetical protein